MSPHVSSSKRCIFRAGTMRVSMAVLSIACMMRSGDTFVSANSALVPLSISTYGVAYEDPCSNSWSNDQKPDHPCPTSAPSPVPSASPTASSAPSSAPTDLVSSAPSSAPTEMVTTIACPPADGENANTAAIETTVTYYYTVEATTSDHADFLAELENKLLEEVADDVLDCGRRKLLESDESENVDENGTPQQFLRSKTSDNHKKEEEEKRILLEQRRRLEAFAISSQPPDSVFTGASCTPKVEGNTCFVLEGKMTVMHDEDDSAENITESVLASIEETTSSGELESIEGVEEVTYLGSSVEDVYAALGGVDESDRGDGDVDGIIAANPNTRAVNSDVGKYVGVTAAAASFLIFLVLLVHRRRQMQSKYQNDDDQLPKDFQPGMGLDEMDSFEESELDDAVNNVLAKGRASDYDAEPGSFHLGQYHYTRDGVRYLSPTCKLCQANGANGGLPTIKEEDNLHSDSFVRADSRDLGQKHSALNVHNCTSSTCDRCQAGSNANVSFVPSNKGKADQEETAFWADQEETAFSQEGTSKHAKLMAFWS